MPEPIAYVYRQARDARGKINPDALGSLIPKDRVEETMEGDRILYIHQPPSSETQPGVLILMDGEQEMRPGDSIKSTPAILDELCKKKQISPQISVYIPAPEDRIGEYACNKEFADFLSNKLVPLLQDPPFCSSKRREQTTIGGTSFGGLAATHAALTHPEIFGNVLSQSGAFWWNKDWKRFDNFEEWGKAAKTSILETTKQATAMAWLSKIPHKEGLPIKFYLSGGEIEEGKTPSLNGESFPGAITLNKGLSLQLAERGHIVKTEIRSGDHNYDSWQADKPTALRILLAKPTPQLVTEKEKTKEYRDTVRGMRQPEPGCMAPKESFKVKKREKFSPLHKAPKP